MSAAKRTSARLFHVGDRVIAPGYASHYDKAVRDGGPGVVVRLLQGLHRQAFALVHLDAHNGRVYYTFFPSRTPACVTYLVNELTLEPARKWLRTS